MTEMIQVAIVIILFIGMLYGISLDISTVKKGQKYRNFFKSVVAGLGIYMLLENITALKISISSTVVFLLYILSVASALAFIPPLMDNNYEWLLIASIVIGLSALLHVYVRFINKVMFNSDLGEAV
ncbi:hypothetical protein [Staphylococcus saprophyticus]|uniref:hypothetical protein n=1 Tax=Staphylococcus saprophyticus TaxID=29385 RepID=UPI00115B6ABC|nr:hypothetical protein [Staphylococcus saprophyticus]